MSKGKIAKTITEMAAELAKKKRAVLPKEDAEANLKKFLDQSKVQQRLYHATPQSFDVFKPGGDNPLVSGPAIWMTPKKESQPAAHNIRKVPGTENRVYGNQSNMFTPGTNVMPLYASLKNPLISTEKTWKKDFEKFGGSPWTLTPEGVEKIKSAGHDGIVYYDAKGNLEEAVAFDSTSVKSAIGNRGTYDIGEEDITKAEGGAVKMQDGDAAETFNEAMLRRTRKFSPTDIEQMRREIAENARRIAAERQARAEDQPPAEMKPYEPTLQQKLGAATERGLRAIGAPANRARELSGVLTGGSTGSPLPLGMSVMDFTPAAIPVYGGQGVINAANAAGQGNYGEAALELGLAALDLSTAIPATKALAGKAKPMVKAGAKALAPKAGELAEQYMMRTGMALPMDVWHGSPHRFPPTAKNPLGEFDPTKIGTGEGAQAYGHGHYLAEVPKVAKGYAEDLTKMRVQAAQSQLNKYGGNVDDAIGAVRKEIDRLKSLNLTPETGAAKRDNLIAGQEEKLAELMAYKNQGSMNKGHLYKVDLPDEQIAKMLDWDKPLSEQPEALKPLLSEIENVGPFAAEKIRVLAQQPGLADWAKRDLLKDAAELEKSKSPQHVAGRLKGMQLEYGINADNGPFQDVAKDFLSFVKGMQAVPNMDTGAGAVSYLQARYGEEAASQMLKDAGIPGIKYLDQGSRGSDEGTRNFVVFPGNEDILTIKERMKKGGPVSMDAMRLAVGGVLSRLGSGISKKAANAAKKAEYSATDRARAGIEAAEMIKQQEQVKASEALGQLMEKGIKKVSTTQSDRTRVGGGNIGGANFPAISLVDPEYAGKVWGVGDKPTAARLINLSSPETVWTTMLGSANQLKTNPIVFDRMKRKFLTEMKAGKLSSELESKINKNLELTFGEGASIRDPKIWKEADTFEKRSALADIMMGQGIPPSKGGVPLGGEKSGKGVIFKPSEILTKETEPALLHTEYGGDVPTYALGPRLFSLGKETYYRPDLHPGFPQLIEGKDFGFNVKPTPTEVFLPDWHKRFKEKFPERKAPPGYYDLSLGLKGEGLPNQELNDIFIRHLIREGFKKGGPVKKASGGEITADDLIVEERSL